MTRSPPASCASQGSPPEGLTNREIAQALFITTKTAKGHLSHVYRKLEITRRGQLANALTDLFDDGGEDLSATAAIS